MNQSSPSPVPVRSPSSRKRSRNMFSPPLSPKSIRRALSNRDMNASSKASRRASAGDVLSADKAWSTMRRPRTRTPMRRGRFFASSGASSMSNIGPTQPRSPRRMSQFLVSTLSRNQFKKFLRTEFSYENLAFVERVKTFEERCQKEPSNGSENSNTSGHSSSSSVSVSNVGGFSSTQRRNAAALDLFFEFLSPNSRNEVYINSPDRLEIEDAFRQAVSNFDEVYSWWTATGIKRLSEMPVALATDPVDANIFTATRKFVWSNIEQDSFQRYLAKVA